jgi:cytochrome oxidase Cu insertion factor (SCO1/SenC/PrrC family)
MRFLLLLIVVGCSRSGGEIPIINPIAEFELTERNGTTITRSHFKGKIWIASFVFTRCTESCPEVSGTVARLQKELADFPEVRFVTFTVDPERDRPEELKRYAERYRADPERWFFLTGSEERIRELLNESFHVAAIRNPDAKTPGQEFDHSSKLAVVDGEGNIRGYFDGMRRKKVSDPDGEFDREIEKLKAMVKTLRSLEPSNRK